MEEMRYISTSVLHGGKWSASRQDRYNPGERVPDTHWIGGRVGPRAGLGEVAKKNITTLVGN
jgi:hypothetical protein